MWKTVIWKTQLTYFKSIKESKSSSLIQEKENSILIVVCVHTQPSPLFTHSCGSIIILVCSSWDKENTLLYFIGYLWHYLCGFLHLLVKGHCFYERWHGANVAWCCIVITVFWKNPKMEKAARIYNNALGNRGLDTLCLQDLHRTGRYHKPHLKQTTQPTPKLNFPKTDRSNKRNFRIECASVYYLPALPQRSSVNNIKDKLEKKIFRNLLIRRFLNRQVSFSLAPIPIDCGNTAPSLLLTTAKTASICLL